MTVELHWQDYTTQDNEDSTATARYVHLTV